MPCHFADSEFDPFKLVEFFTISLERFYCDEKLLKAVLLIVLDPNGGRVSRRRSGQVDEQPEELCLTREHAELGLHQFPGSMAGPAGRVQPERPAGR